MERIEICMRLAKTYMMMAKVLDNISAQSYIKLGVEACKMAIELQKEWDADTTDIIYMNIAA